MNSSPICSPTVCLYEFSSTASLFLVSLTMTVSSHLWPRNVWWMRGWRTTTAGRKEVEALRTRTRLLQLSPSQASLPPRGPSSAPSSPRSFLRDGPTRPTRQPTPLCPTSRIPLLLPPAGTALQECHTIIFTVLNTPFTPNHLQKPPQIPTNLLHAANKLTDT